VRHFLTLLIIVFCFSIVGCKARNKVNDTELATATRAKNNVTAVADTLDKIPGMKPYSDILDDQVRVLDSALMLSVEDQQELAQNFTLKSNLDPVGLAVNPQAEAEKSKEQADKDVKDNEESQTSGWGWVITAGGFALWAARMFNVPGVNLITDPLVGKLCGFVTKPLEQKAAEAQTKAQHLALTVESSMVGRAGLAHLDTKIAGNEDIKKLIAQFTGGKADSIEGLFTHVAHANALDSEDGSHEDVKTVLAEIHNDMKTEGKIPVVLKTIIDTTAELVNSEG
jgi:hypothetical protein